MKEKTEAASAAEVIKQALRLYEFVISEHDKGKTFFCERREAAFRALGTRFDDATIGRLINQCIEDAGSIEMAASLSAIIAKARLAHMKRR